MSLVLALPGSPLRQRHISLPFCSHWLPNTQPLLTARAQHRDKQVSLPLASQGGGPPESPHRPVLSDLCCVPREDLGKPVVAKRGGGRRVRGGAGLFCLTASCPGFQRSHQGGMSAAGCRKEPSLFPAGSQRWPSCEGQGCGSRHQHCLCCDQRPKEHPGFSVCNLKAKTLPFIGSPTQITSLQRRLLSACFFFVYFDARPKSYIFTFHRLIYTLPISKTDDNKTTGTEWPGTFTQDKGGEQRQRIMPSLSLSGRRNLRFHSLGVFKLPQGVRAAFICFCEAPAPPSERQPPPWLCSDGLFPLRGLALKQATCCSR